MNNSIQLIITLKFQTTKHNPFPWTTNQGVATRYLGAFGSWVCLIWVVA